MFFKSSKSAKPRHKPDEDKPYKPLSLLISTSNLIELFLLEGKLELAKLGLEAVMAAWERHGAWQSSLKMDIVRNEDGKFSFISCDMVQYADAILKILRMPDPERLAISAAARKRASRFSQEKFYEDMKTAV